MEVCEEKKEAKGHGKKKIQSSPLLWWGKSPSSGRKPLINEKQGEITKNACLLTKGQREGVAQANHQKKRETEDLKTHNKRA